MIIAIYIWDWLTPKNIVPCIYEIQEEAMILDLFIGIITGLIANTIYDILRKKLKKNSR